jgi:hypothetical protein
MSDRRRIGLDQIAATRRIGDATTKPGIVLSAVSTERIPGRFHKSMQELVSPLMVEDPRVTSRTVVNETASAIMIQSSNLEGCSKYIPVSRGSRQNERPWRLRVLVRPKQLFQ